jgi:dephospho-CoA kinase
MRPPPHAPPPQAPQPQPRRTTGVATAVVSVLVVDTPEDEQVRRTARRSGLAPDDVRAIMATQLARADRLARADDVIDNGGAHAAIAAQVAALDARYRTLTTARAGIAAQ